MPIPQGTAAVSARKLTALASRATDGLSVASPSDTVHPPVDALAAGSVAGEQVMPGVVVHDAR